MTSHDDDINNWDASQRARYRTAGGFHPLLEQNSRGWVRHNVQVLSLIVRPFRRTPAADRVGLAGEIDSTLRRFGQGLLAHRLARLVTSGAPRLTNQRGVHGDLVALRIAGSRTAIERVFATIQLSTSAAPTFHYKGYPFNARWASTRGDTPLRPFHFRIDSVTQPDGVAGGFGDRRSRIFVGTLTSAWHGVPPSSNRVEAFRARFYPVLNDWFTVTVDESVVTRFAGHRRRRPLDLGPNPTQNSANPSLALSRFYRDSTAKARATESLELANRRRRFRNPLSCEVEQGLRYALAQAECIDRHSVIGAIALASLDKLTEIPIPLHAAALPSLIWGNNLDLTTVLDAVGFDSAQAATRALARIRRDAPSGHMIPWYIQNYVAGDQVPAGTLSYTFFPTLLRLEHSHLGGAGIKTTVRAMRATASYRAEFPPLALGDK